MSVLETRKLDVWSYVYCVRDIFVRGRFSFIFSSNIILIEHLKRDRLCRRGRSHKNEATRSPFPQNCSVYEFPVSDGIVSVIENRTAGRSYRSNLHVIQKHNGLIENSDFHDSLHGVDIQRTTANRVRGILEVLFRWCHSCGSHVVPYTFHLPQDSQQI